MHFISMVIISAPPQIIRHTHTHPVDSISLDKLHGGSSLPYLVVLLVTLSHSFKIFEADAHAIKSLMSGTYTTMYVLYIIAYMQA